MSFTQTPLPPNLSKQSQIGDEISVTGKWTAKRSNRFFGMSTDSKGMRSALNSLQELADSSPSVLTFELNDTVGGDAVVVHAVFASTQTVSEFFDNDGRQHLSALLSHAVPDLHLIRGTSISEEVTNLFDQKQIPIATGEFLYGYVKHDSKLPDLSNAIDVTAKWTCTPADVSNQEELKHWWQQVGTDAFDMEKGLIRFEVYQVPGEDALIIHEVFEDTAELKFHLTKGTAHKYKKSIDQIATPERYVFRGNVSWLIRTYSKFMRLPATYSTRTKRISKPGGSMSDGKTN